MGYNISKDFVRYIINTTKNIMSECFLYLHIFIILYWSKRNKREFIKKLFQDNVVSGVLVFQNTEKGFEMMETTSEGFGIQPDIQKETSVVVGDVAHITLGDTPPEIPETDAVLTGGFEKALEKIQGSDNSVEAEVMPTEEDSVVYSSNMFGIEAVETEVGMLVSSDGQGLFVNPNDTVNIDEIPGLPPGGIVPPVRDPSRKVNPENLEEKIDVIRKSEEIEAIKRSAQPSAPLEVSVEHETSDNSNEDCMLCGFSYIKPDGTPERVNTILPFNMAKAAIANGTYTYFDQSIGKFERVKIIGKPQISFDGVSEALSFNGGVWVEKR